MNTYTENIEKKEIVHELQDNVVNCTKPRIVCVCGRRSGKTVGAVRLLVKRMIEHNLRYGTERPGKYWYIAPTLKQARRIIWNEDVLFRYLPSELIHKRSDSTHFLELKDGTTFEALSCENYDDVGRLKGSGLDGVIIDEIDQMPPQVWGEAIKPALSDKEGWAMFIGTPDAGYGTLYELFMAATLRESAREEWQAFHWTFFDNPHIPEREKESIRQDYELGLINEIDWKIQWLGEFSQHSGAVFPEFNLDKHVFHDMTDIPEKCARYLAIDPGYEDPFCCLWAAIDNVGTIWIYREHYIVKQTSDWHLRKIKALTGTEPIAGAFMDPSAKGLMKEYKDRGKPFNRLRSPYRETESKARLIETGIDRIRNRLIEDPILGKPKLKVHSSCEHTIKEFQMWCRKKVSGVDSDKPEDKNNHAMDCLRYLEIGANPKELMRKRTPEKEFARREPLE